MKVQYQLNGSYGKYYVYTRTMPWADELAANLNNYTDGAEKKNIGLRQLQS